MYIQSFTYIVYYPVATHQVERGAKAEEIVSGRCPEQGSITTAEKNVTLKLAEIVVTVMGHATPLAELFQQSPVIIRGLS